MSHFDELSAAGQSAVHKLRSQGCTVRDLDDVAPRPTKEPKVPTDARSEFLANKAMGDWAEMLLAAALRTHFSVTHYGASDDLQAGDLGFPAFYREQHRLVSEQGKRPDLLLLESASVVPETIAMLPHGEREAIALAAIAAIEVRSSKFKALKYMAVRQAQRKAGLKPSRDTPSFTVKVEDLSVVCKWMSTHPQTPQAYFQVFFDSVFAISLFKIFELIAAWEPAAGLKLEKPSKSQKKHTVLIPVTCGEQVATMSAAPTFAARTRETQLGRVDAFVVPEGGSLELDLPAVRRALRLGP